MARAAVDPDAPPFVYAALEESGQAVVGHLDASCKALVGERVFVPRRFQPDPERGDPWPCARCVSLEQLGVWQPDFPPRFPPEEILVPAEKTLEFGPGVADTTGVGGCTPGSHQEDTTMNTTTAPTAQQFGTLKALFADVISNEVPGMVGFRQALLTAHKAGDLSAEAVDQAIDLLGNIVNPCNDDGPVRTYPLLPGLRVATDDGASQVVPAAVVGRAAAKSGPAFEKGMIITNAAGQIVRVSISAAGNAYGKVKVDGYWEYQKGALAGARHLTADEAKAWADQNDHYCVFCQTALEDKRSTDMGYGPKCAKRYALPWGGK